MGTENTGSNTASSIKNLMDLYTLFAGSSGKSSTTTTTTSSNTDPAAISAAVNAALGSANGMANVLGAQRTAGLYGSSTNKLLASRFASDVVAKTTANSTNSTQTSVTTPAKQSGLGVGGLVGLMGLKALSSSKLGDQLMGTAKESSGGVVDKITDALGLTTASPAKEIANKAVSSTANDIGNAVQDVLTSTAKNKLVDEVTSDATDAVASTVDTAIPEVSDAVASTFNLGGVSDAVDSGVSDAVATTVGDAAGAVADTVGDIFSGWFHNGGRVPQHFATGGRVQASTYVGGSRGATDASVQTSLGKYSYAEAAPSAGTSTLDGLFDTSGDAQGGWTGDPNATFGRAATIADMAMSRGITQEEAAQQYSGYVSKGVTTGLGMLGLTPAAIVGKAFDNPVGKAAISGLMGKTDKGLVESLLETLGIVDPTAWAQEARDAAYTHGQQSRDALGLPSVESRYGNEPDPEVEQETAKDSESPYTGITPDDNGSTLGEGTPTDDSISTSPNDDNSGWGGFSSEDAASGSWRKGGRVAGDTNYGADDVKAMLDGGEVVIKATSVQKLDQTFGPKFLDTLNSDPDAVIARLLGK